MAIRSKRLLKEAEIRSIAHAGDTYLARKFTASMASMMDDAGGDGASIEYAAAQERFRVAAGGDFAEAAALLAEITGDLLSAISDALEASRSSVPQEVLNTLRAVHSKFA